MPVDRSSNLKPAGLLACAVFMAATAAHATEVAPYFTAYDYFGNSSKINSLEIAKANGGVSAMTLAFGVAGNGCTISGGLDSIMNDAGAKADVKSFIAQGGRVILSFGGADGTYLEKACSETAMYNLVKNIMDTQNVHNIDFDLEQNSNNSTFNTTRNNVIKRLQAVYPDLYVSFTLGVSPSGLPNDQLNIVKGANSAGVKVSMVNIMTMDYGVDSLGGRTEGAVAIASAQGTQKQLKAIFTGRSDADIWAMIGITPMIGYNDPDGSGKNEIFTIADAQAVTQFARPMTSACCLLEYAEGPGRHRGLQQLQQGRHSDYQFYKIFAAAKTSTQPVNGAFPAGTYTIKSAYDSKCIDINAASTADSAQVQQYTCNGTGAQSFAVIDEGSGWYKILNTNSGKAIDITSCFDGEWRQRSAVHRQWYGCAAVLDRADRFG